MLSTSEPIVRRFVGGPLLTDCYALIVPGRAALIVDAPRDAWRAALDAAEELGAPRRSGSCHARALGSRDRYGAPA